MSPSQRLIMNIGKRYTANLIPVIFVLALCLVSCDRGVKQDSVVLDGANKIEQLSWLVGSWTNITEKEQSYENWHKTTDGNLAAHSFTLVEGDTVFAERVSLAGVNGDLVMTVVAYQQNGNKPVSFTQIKSAEGVFTFENPNHDFPQRINYSNPEADSIHAWIEGTIEGKPRRVDFGFSR